MKKKLYEFLNVAKFISHSIDEIDSTLARRKILHYNHL